MRILIAEDASLLRSLMSEALQAAGHEVDSAADPDELFALVEQNRPDVVLTDIRMPPTFTDEGVRAAERLRETYPDIKIILLSQHAETGFLKRLLEHGASGVGYLLKERLMSLDALTDAIARVAAGECVIDSTLVDGLLQNKTEADPLTTLSVREREVLRFLAEGYSNAGIARQLAVSQRTVETHVARIVNKLGLPDSHEINRRVSAVLAYLRSTDRFA